MYTLYGRPATGSAAVEALLEELGLPYRLENVAKGPDGRPSAHYLANINPLGPVPALKLPDGSVMTESAAMMIYLADLVPGANLAPLPTHPARGQYLRVMLFLAAEIYPADLRLFYSDRYTIDPNGASGVKKAASAEMDRLFDHLANMLGDKPFLLGEEFSALDLYAAMVASWAESVAVLFTRHPNLAQHYARVKARPATARAWARNKMMEL